MDPFIEACGLWEDFHPHLIEKIYEALADTVPEHYTVRSGERSCSEEEFRETFVKHGQDGEGLGRGQRQGNPHAPRPHRRSEYGCLEPRRHPAGEDTSILIHDATAGYLIERAGR